LSFVFSLLALGAIAECRQDTPLDEYVWRPDDSYRWELIQTQRGNAATFYTLFMISQTWYPDNLQDHPYWWHHLQIVVPDNIQFFEYGALRVEGGSSSSSPPGISDDMEMLAVTSGTIIAKLRQVPNQPLVFLDDEELKPRTEDSLIAFTWDKYRRELSNADFLARAPMTKAVIRAMDAITEFTNTLGLGFDINQYFLFGESKRGWTTWTAAAVDDERVVAFAPMVMPTHKFVDSFNYYYTLMGGWSFALYDYYQFNFSCYLNDPSTQRIFDVVDPYTYIDRYTRPKFVILATGDEFFLPDDPALYWDELPEPKYLNLLPNANHGMGTVEGLVQRSMRSFWYAIKTNFPMPKLTWTKEYTETGARITATTDTAPVDVRVWRANTISTVRRDFRWARLNDEGDVVVQPILWRSENATMISENVFVAEFDNPEENTGWLGFFIQVRYPGPKEGEDWDFTFTTEMMVVPQEVPFSPCEGFGCCATLL